MRRGALAVLSVVLVLAAVPVALALPAQSDSLVPVHVSPATGGPRTSFQVSLKIPTTTGTYGGLRHTDSLSVSGPRGSRCLSAAEMALPAAAAETTVRARLVPGKLGGHWCTGSFQGVVTETDVTSCPPEKVCPEFVIAPRTIGRFHFRVRRS